ncbi:Periostin [Liparis tanakae]|uniref:Periostin n=1 Tax=Liparis tanakae TaxID=230148 RepID=A0A4Z2HEU8_9TELE|nr:Periostin [Liparis tanakae]
MHQLLVVTSVLVALCSLGSVDTSAYDKIVTHSRIRARKQGPNVCALQQVMGSKKKYFSTCRNWYKGSICGKKTLVLYECCPGYIKLQGMKGCPAVAPIDHVYGTLGLVKASTTQQYSDISKLREEIEGKGSFTMFAPSNDAWDLVESDVRAALVGNVNIELYNALHFHMVNRRILTKDMKNDMTFTSMIIHGNQVATNGVVHVIDRVISGVGNNMKEVLDVTDELGTFRDALLASDVMDKLDQPGHYTLFAPTDEAFDKLSPGYLERIMGDKTVIAALANYHLLNSVQCSEGIMSGSVYETAEGSTIEIGCDGDTLTVNGIKMVLKKDIVTTNGVIHLIDQVLIPDSAKEGVELMGASLSTFNDMVSELGLAAAIGPKTEYTLLAPVNNAFTTEVMSTEQSLLKYILENHILKLKVTLSELYNGQMLETLAGKLLRVFIYRTAVCIENACMLRGSKEGSKSALHVMNTLIKPAKKTIYELLISERRFKIFLSLMETAGLTDLLKQEGSYTIFAPTDEAFDNLSKEDFALLKSDLNALRIILLYHFSNGIFINGGLEGGVTNLLRTLQGNNLQVNNSILVNSVDVPDSDLMATNGVIHVVKNVLYPADLPVGRQDLLVLLRKLIKYIQIKFISGFSYQEIPLTFIIPGVTQLTRVIQGEPSITKITRVIEGEPSVTKVTRVIEGEPSITKVTRVIEGEPSITKVTRVIEGEPSITHLTRHIEGDRTHTTRVIEGEPSITRITRVIEGEPSITHLTRRVEGDRTHVTRVIEGEPTLTHLTRRVEGDRTHTTRVIEGDRTHTTTRVIEGDRTHVTRVIEGEPSLTHITRVIEGEPSLTHITRVIEGEPSLTHVTRVIEGDRTHVTRVMEGKPTLTHVTRVIEGESTHTSRVIEGDPSFIHLTRVIEGEPSLTHVTRVIEGKPSFTHVTRINQGKPTITKVTRVIEGPDFSKITTIHGNPKMIDQESDRITRLIQGGGGFSAARKAPAGMRRRRPKMVRRHYKPRQ